jgi:hypothetical protein
MLWCLGLHVHYSAFLAWPTTAELGVHGTPGQGHVSTGKAVSCCIINPVLPTDLKFGSNVEVLLWLSKFVGSSSVVGSHATAWVECARSLTSLLCLLQCSSSRLLWMETLHMWSCSSTTAWIQTPATITSAPLCTWQHPTGMHTLYSTCAVNGCVPLEDAEHFNPYPCVYCVLAGATYNLHTKLWATNGMSHEQGRCCGQLPAAHYVHRQGHLT